MANNAVRVNDMTSGHDCFPPQKIIGGSPNVFANERNVVRQGDKCQSHVCGMTSHHSYTEQKIGKRSVFVNGIPPTRLGDTMSLGVDKRGVGIVDETGEETRCTSIVITASSTVFFGE